MADPWGVSKGREGLGGWTDGDSPSAGSKVTGGNVALLLGCMENQDLPCQTHDWKGSGVSGWLGWVDRQMGVPFQWGQWVAWMGSRTDT